jgi:hypothetical protein
VVNELRNRIKLLINYNLLSTYSENYRSIIEQSITQVPTSTQTPEEIRQKDYERKNKIESTYPNYCPYKEYTVLPPKNEFGEEGDKAIPKGWCYYRTPVGGIFLPIQGNPEHPPLTNIGVSSIKSISNQVDVLIKKGTEPESKRESLIKNLSNIIPPDSILSFTLGDSIKYSLRLAKRDDVGIWYPSTFKNKNGDQWINPKVEDVRSSYQKFIDEWGLVIQLGTAAITIIAGIFTAGTAWWLLPAELGLELTVGTMVGLREFEKGNNISGVMSIIFGALPGLKYSKYFRGINPKTFESLSVKMGNAGLNESSSVGDYVKFYNRLNDEEKSLMSQFLEHDDLTKREIIKSVGEYISKKESKDFIVKFDEIFDLPGGYSPGQMIKPENLPLLKKLWVRELGSNGAVIVIDGILNLCCNKQLNNEQKQTFEWIYWKLPETTQEELLVNFVNYANKSPEILDSIKNDPVYQDLKDALGEEIRQSAENVHTYLDSVLSDNFNENGAKYIQLSSDSTESNLDLDRDLKVNNEELDSLKNNGWVLMSDLPYEEWPEDFNSDNLKTINGERYIKK